MIQSIWGSHLILKKNMTENIEADISALVHEVVTVSTGEANIEVIGREKGIRRETKREVGRDMRRNVIIITNKSLTPI